MPTITTTTRINAPVERVFDLMADSSNEVAWNSYVSSSERLGDEPVGLGSRFRTVNRGQPYDATIVEYDRPNRVGWEVTAAQTDITAGIRFAASGEGTVMETHFDFRPKGPSKVVFALLTPLVRRAMPKEFANFAAFCERSSD